MTKLPHEIVVVPKDKKVTLYAKRPCYFPATSFGDGVQLLPGDSIVFTGTGPENSFVEYNSDDVTLVTPEVENPR